MKRLIVALALVASVIGLTGADDASAHDYWHLNRNTCRYELWKDLGNGIHYYSGYSIRAPTLYCY